MKVNIMELRGKMVATGYSVSKLASAIGLHRSTFYRKLRANANDFTIGEMHKICDVLHLESEEAARIFLS